MNVIDSCAYLLDNDEHTLSALLRQMDQLKIDCAVLHPSDRCFAFENEEGNEAMLSAVSRYPGRFIPALTVNPWRRNASVMLESFARGGAKLFSFSPALQGFNVCEDTFSDALENLSQLESRPAIYIHTGHYSFGAPSQVALAAKRFGQLTFIIGHSGATDFAADIISSVMSCRNIYIESSFARPSAFVSKASQTDFERAIFGSGYPFNSPGFELSEMKKMLPVQQHKNVLCQNLMKLLGIPK